jgi:uncharacterized protein
MRRTKLFSVKGRMDKFLIRMILVSVGLILPTAAISANSELGDRIAEAALARTALSIRYDPSYARIDYPGGDVPADRGVCADVIIRSLRKVDIDLQQLVHEDMSSDFSAYPDHWGLTRPDPNIDHRRVPNLERYFTRAGVKRPQSREAGDFEPGDIVAWNLRGASGGWLPHVGIVSAEKAPSGRPLIVHNIGAGVMAEDVLFAWPMTGHYRIGPDGLGD